MLKAYAVALALSTSTPVTENKQEGVDKAPEQQKEVATQAAQYWRPNGDLSGIGLYWRPNGDLSGIGLYWRPNGDLSGIGL